METAVDLAVLVDAVTIFSSREVESRGGLPERLFVGGIPVDLVCAHEHERRFPAALAHRLQEIESADGVDVEIVEHPGACQVMGRLSGAMNDQVRTDALHDGADGLTVAHIEREVFELPGVPTEALQDPRRVSIGPEEIAP